MITTIREMLGMRQQDYAPKSDKYHFYVSDRFSGIVKKGQFTVHEQYGNFESFGHYILSKPYDTEKEARKAFEDGDLFKDFDKEIKKKADLSTSIKRIVDANKEYYEELLKLAEKTPKMDVHLLDNEYYSAIDINFMVDEITLTDKTIEHIIQGIMINFQFRGKKCTASPYGTRYKFTDIELALEYAHSHLHANPRSYSRLCWGNEMSTNVMKKLSDPKQLKEGMTDLIRFLAFESKEGVPYRNLRELFKNSSASTYKFNYREMKIIAKSGALDHVKVTKQDHDSTYLIKITDPEQFTDSLMSDIDFAEFFNFSTAFFGSFDKASGLWQPEVNEIYKEGASSTRAQAFNKLMPNNKRKFWFKGNYIIEELVPNKTKDKGEFNYNTFNQKTIRNLELQLTSTITTYLRKTLENYGRNTIKGETLNLNY